MRPLASFGFAIALMSWWAGTTVAAPPPFLRPQRVVGLPLSATSLGQHPQTAQPGVLYSFGSGTDANPVGGLAYVNGVFYGTTCTGGTVSPFGLGTVFAVNAAGAARVLHTFNGTDGACPVGGLTDVNGVLYGTTANGGLHGVGNVFAITTNGAERVLHDFDYTGTGGDNPMAGLLAVNGVLYGTTTQGGKYGNGTVFAITTAGVARALYSFENNSTDAGSPWSGLIFDNGVFYGTSQAGGSHGSGTVFTVTADGVERVLYSFRGSYSSGPDGAFPFVGLTEVNGVFYGTTLSGGTYGQGTVFSITKAGSERVLHNFGRRPDGRGPFAGLIDVNGILYGTTSGGGRYSSGTIFAITTAGSEHVLRDFGFCDGPEGQLIDVNGVLYGTTEFGGTNHSGTLFFESP